MPVTWHATHPLAPPSLPLSLPPSSSFYTTLTTATNTISLGDAILVHPAETANPPYIALLEAIFMEVGGEGYKVVVRW